MKKTFMTPSMEVKEFNRLSILTASGADPAQTNEGKAKTALSSAGIEESNIVTITL